MVKELTLERGTRLILGPNRSLTARQLYCWFGAIAMVSIGIAIYWAMKGLWMPLPFAGLELALLWTCLSQVQKGSRQHEIIDLDDDAVRLWHAPASLDRQADWSFPPAWLRVQLAADRRSAWYPRRLLLSYAGKTVEVGAFLPDAEREDLARRIKGLLAEPANTY